MSDEVWKISRSSQRRWRPYWNFTRTNNVDVFVNDISVQLPKKPSRVVVWRWHLVDCQTLRFAVRLVRGLSVAHHTSDLLPEVQKLPQNVSSQDVWDVHCNTRRDVMPAIRLHSISVYCIKDRCTSSFRYTKTKVSPLGCTLALRWVNIPGLDNPVRTAPIGNLKHVFKNCITGI